ncbi:hypothetical protein BC828DRAFT_375809 [Blastocladiella britannica]|nr:hypothetical protein BC828DRAFT_375809 [Blastocladiella britannica]
MAIVAPSTTDLLQLQLYLTDRLPALYAHYAAVPATTAARDLAVWSARAGFRAGPIYVSYVAVMHAMAVTAALLNKMHPETGVLHSWVALLVLSFGGTTLTAILLARTPGWFATSDPLTIYTLVYLAYRYLPLVLRIHNLLGLPLNLALAAADGASRALAISAFAIDTVRSLPAPINTSLPAIVLGGTLSGCGGGLIAGVFGVTQREWRVGAPRATFDVLLAATVAVGYASATSPLMSSVVGFTIVDAGVAKGGACLFAAAALMLQVLYHWARNLGLKKKRIVSSKVPPQNQQRPTVGAEDSVVVSPSATSTALDSSPLGTPKKRSTKAVRHRNNKGRNTP